MTIILRRFDYRSIPENGLLFIVGMLKSGKSFLTKDLLHYFNDIPMGMVISELSNNEYTYNYIPPIVIHDTYEKKIIKKFLKRQDMIVNIDDYDSRAFLILSNCYYKDKYFKQVITSNKAYNYLCIFETDNLQKIDKIDNNFKENIDYLFILKDNLDINRRCIYNKFSKYLGIEYSLFNKLIDDYTDNYNFLVLDLKIISNSIEDKLFWYKANNHNNFIICNKECWDYNNKNYIKQPPIKELNRSIFY
jgi:hypothetical protein